jgi:hypothetical protein
MSKRSTTIEGQMLTYAVELLPSLAQEVRPLGVEVHMTLRHPPFLTTRLSHDGSTCISTESSDKSSALESDNYCFAKKWKLLHYAAKKNFIKICF